MEESEVTLTAEQFIESLRADAQVEANVSRAGRLALPIGVLAAVYEYSTGHHFAAEVIGSLDTVALTISMLGRLASIRSNAIADELEQKR
jgi:hypothetical protein